MPEQMWDALFWVIVISTIGGWVIFILKWAYKYFIEEKAK